MKKKRLFLLSLLLLPIILCLGGIKANAESLNITSKELYDSTNTFNYLYEESDYGSNGIEGYDFNNSARYDLSVSNGNVVSNTVALTVLTHGLGGDASNWSNNGEKKLTNSNDSIVSRLFNAVNSNVILIRTSSLGCNFYDITDQYTDNVNNSTITLDEEVVLNSLDYSKHTIVIYEENPYDDGSYESHDSIYTRFNFAISKLVYEWKNKDINGYLPKMNLIGHSRGGITNLQYAMDHPRLINQIFSIGTPYLGSSTALLDVNLLNCAIGSSPSMKDGERDIVNSDIYLGFMNRWNDNYEELYSSINVEAIACYGTIDLYKKIIKNDITRNFFVSSGYPEEVLDVLAIIINLLYPAAYYNKFVNVTSFDELKEYVFEQYLKDFDNKYIDMVIELMNIWCSEITIKSGFSSPVWLSDGLVDYNSQCGKNSKLMMYKGFNIYSRKFTEKNADLTKLAMTNMPPVIHNLETMDNLIIFNILNKIDLEEKVLEEYYIYDVDVEKNEIGIQYYLPTTYTETLNIPSVIDGKTVVEIGNSAFANDFNGNNTITTINIPSTIRNINESAFENNTVLSKVNFEGEGLENIEEFAFANCPNLNSISLPSSVSYFHNTAFLNSSLEDIEIDENNLNYLSKDGVVYNKDFTNLILYPKMKSDTSFTLPNEIISVSNNAFYGNECIQSINLNNVVSIFNEAFMNCINLEKISGNDVSIIYGNAFCNTKWYDSCEDIVVLGKTLISCKVNEERVDFSKYEFITVSNNAIYGLSNINEIVFPESLLLLNEDSISGCSNVEKIYLPGDTVLPSNIFNDSIEFYVSRTYYEKYLSYDYNFNEIISNITLYTEDNEVINDSITYYYGEEYNFNDYYISDKKYNVYDENGNYYNVNSIWKSCEENINTYIEHLPIFILKNENGETIYSQYINYGCTFDFVNNMIIIDNNVVYTLKELDKYSYYEYSCKGDLSSGIFNEENCEISVQSKYKEYSVIIINCEVIDTDTGTSFSDTIKTNLTVNSEFSLYDDSYANYEVYYSGTYFDENHTELFTNMKDLIDRNSSEDLVFELYNKWEITQYEITLDAGIGKFGTESTISITAMFGEIITSSKPNCSYATISGWTDGLNTIYVDSSGRISILITHGFVFDSMKTNTNELVYIKLTSIWEYTVFSISYNKLYDYEPTIAEYKSGKSLPISYSVNNNDIFYSIECSAMYSDGFYLDSQFKKKITDTCNQVGNLFIYINWKLKLSVSRTDTYTITDSGRMNQPMDKILLPCDSSWFINYNYDTLYLKIEFTRWEVNDGYQYIFLYTGNSSPETILSGYNYTYDETIGIIRNYNEHSYMFGSSKTATSITYYLSVDINDIINNRLFLLYGASGTGADKWRNNNLNITFSVFNNILEDDLKE